MTKMAKSLWDIMNEEVQKEIDSEILRELYKTAWDIDTMTKKKQYEQIDKFISRANSIKEHLGNVGLTLQFDDVQVMVSEAFEIKKNCVSQERKLRASEMIRLNDMWEMLVKDYANIK